MIDSKIIKNYEDAVQMTSRVNDIETVFATLLLKTNEEYRENCTKHYYIVMVLSGELTVSSKLYRHRLIEKGTMTFIPRGGEMILKAGSDANILLFGFTTTIIRSDKDLLNYFCTNAGKKAYTFNTLPICGAMDDLLKLITRQLHEKKLKNSDICNVWNTYFFHIMLGYYEKDKIIAFLRPIISGGVDLQSFIENNYLEAEGNVSRLIALSGLSVMTFKTKFNAIYGMTAKRWLDERQKEQILEHAIEKNMGTNQLAHILNMLPQKLNRICHRFWGITAGEVIRRVQVGDTLP